MKGGWGTSGISTGEFHFPNKEAVDIVRPRTIETTALGAAYLAGLATGYWPSVEALHEQWQVGQVFKPKLSPERVQHMLHYWHKAVRAARHWIEE